MTQNVLSPFSPQLLPDLLSSSEGYIVVFCQNIYGKIETGQADKIFNLQLLSCLFYVSVILLTAYPHV